MNTRTPWLSLMALLAGLFLASGCTRINQDLPAPTTEESHAFSSYWSNRGYDAMDMIRLQWGVPRDFKAFGISAKATALLQAGLVIFEGKKVGLERRAIGIKRQEKLEGGISPVYFTTIREAGEFGNYFMRTDTEWAETRDRRIIRNGFFWSDGTARPISFGLELEMFCLGGPDLMLYICEVGDFFAGWVGLDPRGDDLSRLTHAELDNQFFGDEP
jgi:hypothetical protein